MLNGCTALLVGKDATVDGSVLAAMNSDGGTVGWLKIEPGTQHPPNQTIPIYRDWRGQKRDIAAQVPEVRETFQYLGTDYLPCMNEHQVAMVFNACRSRRLLKAPSDSCISHFQLMRIALARARTAREAIEVMGGLVEKYGLVDIGPFPSGKNIGVTDPNEAWWVQLPGGHQWVAQRVPDDAFSVNANRFWVGPVDLSDKRNDMASSQLISYAVHQHWHDPTQGKPFHFAEAYGDNDGDAVPSSMRIYSALREWRALSLASEKELPVPEQGKPWNISHVVVPARKLSLRDVMSILRDHYVGTPFDTTLPENGGGECGCPHPPFKIPTPYPRPIDMFNTQLSYIAQSRGNLPHTIGGVVWFAFHSPSTGCYVPFYAAGTRLPAAYATGEQEKGAAFWRFFTLGNMVNQRWCDLYNRVRDTYNRLEQNWMERQVRIEKEALGLLQKDETLVPAFLSEYSNSLAQEVLNTCQELTYATQAHLAEHTMRETLDEPRADVHL
jgi:dipeptidase